MKANYRILSVILIAFLFAIPIIFNSVFAVSPWLNSTITDLGNFTAEKKSISFFYPVFFGIAIALFMTYALIKREDKIAAIFSLAACVLCVVMSLMFLAPIDYTYQVSETRITAEQSQLTPTQIVNNTSVVKDDFNTIMIPNDKQFRFIISSFFSLFSLLNGLLTVLIFTKWGNNG